HVVAVHRPEGGDGLGVTLFEGGDERLGQFQDGRFLLRVVLRLLGGACGDHQSQQRRRQGHEPELSNTHRNILSNGAAAADFSTSRAPWKADAAGQMNYHANNNVHTRIAMTTSATPTTTNHTGWNGSVLCSCWCSYSACSFLRCSRSFS